MSRSKEVSVMTLCPIALAVGCEKCPMFKFCPLTTVIGDQKKEDPAKTEEKDEPPKSDPAP